MSRRPLRSVPSSCVCTTASGTPVCVRLPLASPAAHPPRHLQQRCLYIDPTTRAPPLQHYTYDMARPHGVRGTRCSWLHGSRVEDGLWVRGRGWAAVKLSQAVKGKSRVKGQVSRACSKGRSKVKRQGKVKGQGTVKGQGFKGSKVEGPGGMKVKGQGMKVKTPRVKVNGQR